MKRKYFNKGELTTTHLVGLIVLIASFAVILFFIFRLNPTEVTQDEICHNSVVLRGKGHGLVGDLDCRTSYVCVSGGSSCEGFTSTEEISLVLQEKPEEKVFGALADELAQCWWMFGEGKIDYGGAYLENSCGICSIVQFDEEIKNTFSTLKSEDFYAYLEKNKLNDEQTYLNYLYATNSLENLNAKIDLEGFSLGTGDIDLTKQYFVVTGANSEVIGGDEYVPPILISSDDPQLRDICGNYDLTKA